MQSETTTSEMFPNVSTKERNHWSFVHELEVESDQVIGRGSTSLVLRGRYSGRPVAVKSIPLLQNGNSLQLSRYLALLPLLSHRRLVHFYKLIKPSTETHLLLVMELATGGDLNTELDRVGQLSEQVSLQYYAQIGSALRYLHQNGIAHRDIQPANVVLFQASSSSPNDQEDNNNKTCKLTDLGCARQVFKSDTGERVWASTRLDRALGYRAPEELALRLGGANVMVYDALKSDVWALGVLLHRMLNTKVAFDVADGSNEALQRVYDQQMNGLFEMTNKQLSDQVVQLICAHLQADPVDRPSMNSIFSKHSCIPKLDKDEDE